MPVEDSSQQIQQIVDYLNNKTGCSYLATTKTTQKNIKALLKQNFTVEDFKKVIDSRVELWQNDSKMRQYLRPITLFSNKFESYLQYAKQNDISKTELGYLVE